MFCRAYPHEWTGTTGARRHGHRCGPPHWLFTRGGRPRFEDLDDLIALRRMWKGGPGWGVQRPGRPRVRRGEVRLALLRLLAEEPRNGYQLMQAIEERSEGLWRPSPGSVYPTLAQLEDEGLVVSGGTERARRFELTDAGREQLDHRRDEPDPWRLPADDTADPLPELAPLVVQIGKAALQVATAGDPAQHERARVLLAETRRALYRILAEDDDGAGTP
jgi:DNA-binding PadR family transcriptional regulator